MVNCDRFVTGKAVVPQQIIIEFGKPNDTQIDNLKIPKKVLANLLGNIPSLILGYQRTTLEILQTTILSPCYTAAVSKNLVMA